MGGHHVRIRTLAVMLGLVAMAGWAARAVDDENSCIQACKVEHARCISACGEHSNPVECEATCRETFEDCERRCYR